MAGYQTKTFSKHDDYMTPESAWKNIKKYIPQDKMIWEAFYGDGTSGNYLRNLGFNVIHEDIDFFDNDLGEIIISNPPFQYIPEILERLKRLDKPFIMIMPTSKIHTQYFRKIFQDETIQLIIPRRRIQFWKMIDDEIDYEAKRVCNFDCFYYCWQIDLPRDIIFLSDDECCEMKSINI